MDMTMDLPISVGPSTLGNFEHHEVLGNEYCSGYMDIFNQWQTGFYCPQSSSSLAVYCCGTPVYKYCCTAKPTGATTGDDPSRSNNGEGTGRDQDDPALLMSDTPLIIAITGGIVAVAILVIVWSCFFCSCCYVNKKRTQVPGMYRMQESSTTSSFQNQNQSLLSHQQNNISSASHHQNPPGNSHQHHPTLSSQQSTGSLNNIRPIISIQPQLTMVNLRDSSNSPNNNVTSGPLSLSPMVVTRSNSLGSTHHLNLNPNQGHHLQGSSPSISVFHIGSHPSIIQQTSNSNFHQPQRFSSNQNLPSYVIADRRDNFKFYDHERSPTPPPYQGIQLGDLHQYNHHPISSYRGGDRGDYQHQFSLISSSTFDPHDDLLIDLPYLPAKKIEAYCSATLPSNLRRMGSSGGGSVTSSSRGGPLKSILRNPLTTPTPPQQPQQPSSYSSSSFRSYTPIITPTSSMINRGPGGGGPSGEDETMRRRAGIHEDSFDFGSESDEQMSYSSYTFPDYSPNGESYTKGEELGGTGSGSGSSRNNNTNANLIPTTTRRYSNPKTEYQNDISRLGKDLDPEALRQLIELDLDSKL